LEKNWDKEVSGKSNIKKGDLMENEKVKEFVKKRYGEIAKTEKSCACSSSCCGPSTKDIAQEIGYSETDLENVPDLQFWVWVVEIRLP